MPHKNLKSLIDFASQQMRSEFDNATHIFASNKHNSVKPPLLVPIQIRHSPYTSSHIP